MISFSLTVCVLSRLFFELFCLRRVYGYTVLIFLIGTNRMLETLVNLCITFPLLVVFAVMEDIIKVLGMSPGGWAHVHI